MGLSPTHTYTWTVLPASQCWTRSNLGCRSSCPDELQQEQQRHFREIVLFFLVRGIVAACSRSTATESDVAITFQVSYEISYEETYSLTPIEGLDLC